jgi:hypothetical protein
MNSSDKESNHRSPFIPGTEAWENEGGATAARTSGATRAAKKRSPSNREDEMTDNLRVPAAILASAMLDSGRGRTHDELMKHYREFLKRLVELEASGIHQSWGESSSR